MKGSTENFIAVKQTSKTNENTYHKNLNNKPLFTNTQIANEFQKQSNEETHSLLYSKNQKNENETIKKPKTQNNPNFPNRTVADSQSTNSQLEINANFFIKLIIAFGGLLTIFINTIYGFLFPHGNVGCMEDLLFENSKFVNDFFAANTKYRNFMLITASFCIDASLIYILVIWVSYGKSYRFLVALSVFYGLRSSVQSLFQMRFPEGYLWEYPGFPSLVVSYLKTNDFFFSGHVGLPIIIICELYKMKKFIMIYFTVFTLFLEFFTMIALRGHYSIDLVTGIFMAHYCYILTEKYIHHLDNFAKINIMKEESREEIECNGD